MIKKIKRLIQENRQLHKQTQTLLNELEWANVYHDSIRGKEWLGKLPINVGRWAGNYSFFYVLNRILSDYKPLTILEFGLGESTKFVSSYISNELLVTQHTVLEQDEEWMNIFKQKFQLSSRSLIQILPLKKKEIKGFQSNGYDGIENVIQSKYDLYIIDGPFGSKNYSRYDIVYLAQKFEKGDEFIIMMDDYNRIGEKETVADLLKIFEDKGIKIYANSYEGNKSVMVLGTEKYRFVKSL